ncbi:hypothetical protein EYC80_003107 [Monilinia laxa]|nr:hypothetical protein EYC80_003107 [Monilinia laxa]
MRYFSTLLIHLQIGVSAQLLFTTHFCSRYIHVLLNFITDWLPRTTTYNESTGYQIKRLGNLDDNATMTSFRYPSKIGSGLF